jgi:hypothetical protein
MTTAEVVTVIALVAGPVVAVGITLWHQGRSNRRQAKERLFIILMAFRKSNPPTLDWANSLNLIDVIFADHTNVVAIWHDLYDIMTAPQPDWGRWNHRYIELLSEMATALGYRRLRQTDIDKFYLPKAHGTQSELNQAIQMQLLAVLSGDKALKVSVVP